MRVVFGPTRRHWGLQGHAIGKCVGQAGRFLSAIDVLFELLRDVLELPIDVPAEVC